MIGIEGFLAQILLCDNLDVLFQFLSALKILRKVHMPGAVCLLPENWPQLLTDPLNLLGRFHECSGRGLLIRVVLGIGD